MNTKVRQWVMAVLGVCLVLGVAGCGGRSQATPIVEYTVVKEKGETTVREVVVDESVAAPAPAAAPGGGVQVNDESYARQSATAGEAKVDAQTGLNRMVIYNANLSLVVKDTVAALEAARQVVQAMEGYITESNIAGSEDQRRASMKARVPAEKLTESLYQLKKIALDVEHESVSGQDVTDEYTDLDARLRNLEASEQQYLKIMDRAVKIEDVLAVQRELTQVRGEIEQIQGRRAYLSKNAAMATIAINFTPDVLAQPVNVGGWRPQGTARDALEALINALETLGDMLIWTAICVLPVGLLVGVPLFLVGRWGIKRLRASRKPKARGEASAPAAQPSSATNNTDQHE